RLPRKTTSSTSLTERRRAPGVIGDSAPLTSDPALEHRGDRARTTTVNSNDDSGLTVAVHQPHYLPWLGLIDKIDRSDRYIVLDTVQFERRGWQNRNYIAGAGKPLLLTVPVEQTSRDELIMDKTIDRSEERRGGEEGTSRWGPERSEEERG